MSSLPRSSRYSNTKSRTRQVKKSKLSLVKMDGGQASGENVKEPKREERGCKAGGV